MQNITKDYNNCSREWRFPSDYIPNDYIPIGCIHYWQTEDFLITTLLQGTPTRGEGHPRGAGVSQRVGNYK